MFAMNIGRCCLEFSYEFDCDVNFLNVFVITGEKRDFLKTWSIRGKRTHSIRVAMNGPHIKWQFIHATNDHITMDLFLCLDAFGNY